MRLPGPIARKGITNLEPTLKGLRRVRQGVHPQMLLVHLTSSGDVVSARMRESSLGWMSGKISKLKLSDKLDGSTD